MTTRRFHKIGAPFTVIPVICTSIIVSSSSASNWLSCSAVPVWLCVPFCVNHDVSVPQRSDLSFLCVCAGTDRSSSPSDPHGFVYGTGRSPPLRTIWLSHPRWPSNCSWPSYSHTFDPLVPLQCAAGSFCVWFDWFPEHWTSHKNTMQYVPGAFSEHVLKTYSQSAFSERIPRACSRSVFPEHSENVHPCTQCNGLKPLRFCNFAILEITEKTNGMSHQIGNRWTPWNGFNPLVSIHLISIHFWIRCIRCIETKRDWPVCPKSLPFVRVDVFHHDGYDSDKCTFRALVCSPTCGPYRVGLVSVHDGLAVIVGNATPGYASKTYWCPPVCDAITTSDSGIHPWLVTER